VKGERGSVLNAIISILRVESCSDGLKNQDETDIDCGGACRMCPTCFDGLWNQDETGIDCGGVCKKCPQRSLFGRIVMPPEVKAGDEFVLLLEVKSVGGVFEGVNSRLSLPSHMQTSMPLDYSLGTMGDGDSRNLTWPVRVGEGAVGGEYPIEMSVYSSEERLSIRDVLRVRELSFVREFREGVFAFMENSLNVVSDNPSVVLLPVAILIGLVYIYYRVRR
jgi:hypothetical protein